MDKRQVKSGYNKIASEYAKTRDQFKNTQYLEKLNSFLKPNSTLLDIGCGSGKPIDEFFIQRGHQMIGIDVSEKQIELARQNFPNAMFVLKDMDQLLPEEYRVDAVISFYAIFHIPREMHFQLFQKINSFLPTGGYLLVTMGSSDWEGKEDFFGAEMHWSHYGRAQNREIIENSGFEILVDEIDTSGNEQHQVVLAKKR